MFKTTITTTKSITASDGTRLSEILHPKFFRDTYMLPYSIAHASLQKNQSSTPHLLKKSTELYIILDGKGIVTVDDETKEVKKDDIILIPPGAVQSIKNKDSSTLSFLCIVSPPWKKEDEEVLKQ